MIDGPLADFDSDAIPGIAATLAVLAAGAWIDAGSPVVDSFRYEG